ncbi:MAG TPA: hypothetical protein ENJ36_00995 [Candidatus Bathyarchaeota archaeon]|nr:hypothetical protein [Candidatus Bathyarchaeota archaeon]
MKPYRRNYAIGIACFLVGLALMFLSPGDSLDTIGKIMAVGGFILAGWSGRQWWYYEKQAGSSD